MTLQRAFNFKNYYRMWRNEVTPDQGQRMREKGEKDTEKEKGERGSFNKLILR